MILIMTIYSGNSKFPLGHDKKNVCYSLVFLSSIFLGALLSFIKSTNFLMMSFVMNCKVASLSCFIGTFWTLKCRRFSPTFDHFMTTHCALPTISFSTKSAPKFALLFMRNPHINNTQICWLWQDLKWIWKDDFSSWTIITLETIVIVVTATVASRIKMSFTNNRWVHCSLLAGTSWSDFFHSYMFVLRTQ